MLCRVLVGLLLAIVPIASASAPPASRDVELAAADGVALKATYYPAAQPGPGVLLLHMCNTDRRSWAPLGPRLAAAGFHARALDYRGYGESGGERFENEPQKQQRVVTEKWPGDVDAALAWLVAQPGVDERRIGAAGGSCGVNQAVQLARRHPEATKALVLLAGGTSRAGVEFLATNPWLPVFAAAAADDQYDADAPTTMRWFTELTANGRNRFAGFADGRHGTEIFGPHPELVGQIVDFCVDTLVKSPTDPRAPVTGSKSPAAELWVALGAPTGTTRALEIYRAAREREPGAFLFPEALMNQVVYERIQAGQAKDAIALAKLNTEAFPTSANAWDTLADAYVADGQREAAMQAAHVAIEKLPGDKSNKEFKERVRGSAEQKLKLPADPAKNP
jgi:dienelactone hydrolase